MNRLLLAAVCVSVAFFALGLTLRTGDDFSLLVDGLLGGGSQVLAAGLAWSNRRAARARRREVTVMATGLTVFSLSNALYLTLYANGHEYPFPGPPDFGLAAFYPLALISVALAARRELRRAGPAVWLDSALGVLGSGAVLAVVLDQVVLGASGDPLGASVALFYPICDLFLAAFVVGVMSAQGRRLRPYWAYLLAGLTAFIVTDVLSAVALLTNTYRPGGLPDVLWSVGLALMAMWTGARARPVDEGDDEPALLLPALATVASLGVLLAAGINAVGGHVSALALVLAALTQLATGARTLYAFQQLRRLADLRRQATTDDLTGLANRRAFYADAEARLTRDRPGVLLLLDLDRFKEVNDSLGHHVGDQLLIEIAHRLAGTVRPGDLLARLGGDEFAMLIDGTDETVEAIARTLRAEIARPCTLEGIALRTDASIGVALVPGHGTTLSLLLRRADIAMYQAKQARRGHQVYAGESDEAGPIRLRVLQELHTALERHEMTLHYQPKLDLATGEVHSVEALVRWSHPQRGLLYPDAFLGLAEDAGMMPRLNQVVLEEALDQAVLWRRAGNPLAIAVNLSPSSLVDADLPTAIDGLLRARDLPATALEIEVTEEFLMADRDRTRHILAGLRDLGITIAVDDFGTGYSSLAYLRELPVDHLKLDRSFVFPMAQDPRAAALVFSTIELAHSLGLTMVAEGVEDEPTLTALAERGCDQAQGYFISRPVSAPALDAWLAERQAVPASTSARTRQARSIPVRSAEP